MLSFRDVPIRRKLTLIIMLTSGISLLLAGTLIVLYERGAYRNRLVEELAASAKLIGYQSDAALSFNDPKTAQQNLTTLHLNPEIVAAAIYDSNGKIFAQYHAAAAKTAPVPPQTQAAGHHFGASELELFQAIGQPGEKVGTVYLRASLNLIQAQLAHYIGIVAAVIAALLLATLGLSTIIQRAISDPILELAQVAQIVSEKKDYSIRAPGQRRDEIGLLTDTFNHMLTRIEESDNALRTANDALHKEVVERQRAEASLQDYASKLAQRNRELQDFAYVASHDLQEPLRAIQNFSDRLKTKHSATLNDEARDYLQRMQNAAGRMRVLIQDLLAYSRVSTKTNPFVPTDLQPVAQAVVADLAGRLEETGGRVEVGALPTIAADGTQMRQLLQNLIGNALKFHRPDVPPVVKVKCIDGDTDGVLHLTVEDNGIGFDEKYTERIFVPFQRLHNQRQYEGTGIGLAICHKIVERHGGRITARSTPGQGATFHITLPRRQPEGEVTA